MLINLIFCSKIPSGGNEAKTWVRSQIVNGFLDFAQSSGLNKDFSKLTQFFYILGERIGAGRLKKMQEKKNA